MATRYYRSNDMSRLRQFECECFESNLMISGTSDCRDKAASALRRVHEQISSYCRDRIVADGTVGPDRKFFNPEGFDRGR